MWDFQILQSQVRFFSNSGLVQWDEVIIWYGFWVGSDSELQIRWMDGTTYNEATGISMLYS